MDTFSKDAPRSGSLLTDLLISSTSGNRYSLPGLLAAMARREVDGFATLRPHQRPAWHMFLVQLAVLALDRSGQAEPPEAEADWAALLRGLTPDFADDEPWHLVVSDRKKPAFMQPPDPGGLKWTPVPTPDALDILITSRNHDLKSAIATQATPEDWLFALVSLQTQRTFDAQYHGITRAKSAAGSRAFMALAPARDGSGGCTPDMSAWWCADVMSVLEVRRKSDFSYLPKYAPCLLWLLHWPLGSQLDVTQVDPLFIETCTRARLVSLGERLTGQISVSKPIRVIRENISILHEPWSPRNGDGEPFNIGPREFTYTVICDTLLSGKWAIPETLSRKIDKDYVLVFEALSLAKSSKTDGFKSRTVPVPKSVVPGLFRPQAVDLSSEQRGEISKVNKALVDALARFHAGGPVVKWVSGRVKWYNHDGSEIDDKSVEKHREAASKARAAFDRRVDAIFFPALWDRMQAPDKRDAASRFQQQLVTIAQEEFGLALPGIPCAVLFRPRAEARARRAFWARLKRENIDTRKEERDDAA
nr:hypothetical protein [uncultured Roseovarius sp.]